MEYKNLDFKVKFKTVVRTTRLEPFIYLAASIKNFKNLRVTHLHLALASSDYQHFEKFDYFQQIRNPNSKLFFKT